MIQRKCLECGDSISGRSDKKFCGDNCRNLYNSRIDVTHKNLIRNTNNRLRKNFKILSELNKNGKTKVTKLKLVDRNFDFNYFTSTYTTQAGSTYFYVYNQGYLELENDIFLLIKKNID